MNERINELMVKAGIEIKSRRPYIDEEPDGYLESDNDFFLNNHYTIIRIIEEGGLEKFAELIVQDILAVVKSEHKLALEFQWDADDTANAIRDAIKKQFGVEE